MEDYFKSTKCINDNNKNKLDLKVSLRSHRAGKVSDWVNEVMASNISKAKNLSNEIKKQNFELLITRDLNKAKGIVLINMMELWRRDTD
ncbi:DNA/RNA helicase domain-containing protein [Cytobacillus sp. FSL H8-0458]|uniref:DNA/RNA helicase domain-containing protein n=1 Tax=Cytobacillus sp. FSL H8-0458 TaxID=2975346 RepID=UPI004046935D